MEFVIFSLRYVLLTKITVLYGSSVVSILRYYLNVFQDWRDNSAGRALTAQVRAGTRSTHVKVGRVWWLLLNPVGSGD